jgi:hypothetical protein
MPAPRTACILSCRINEIISRLRRRFLLFAAMKSPPRRRGTQIIKSELLINAAAYYVHQDPSPILWVLPSQGAAASFSKERFAPTIEATPALRDLIAPPRARDSENTITHKSYAGGSLDFVGANSPTDLASRPKRIILSDEIDKYPPSAGAEGDPLSLAEERASTYHAIGRAKFVRTCSPTVKGHQAAGEGCSVLGSSGTAACACMTRLIYCGPPRITLYSTGVRLITCEARPRT